MRILPLLTLSTALSVPSNASLILHYPVNSTTVVNNTIEDTSPTQENDGLRSGGNAFPLTTDRNGAPNEAVTFPGGIAVTQDNGIATSGGTFSMMTWFKGTDVGYIFDQESDRFVFSLGQSTTGIGVHFNSGTGIWYQNNITGANDGGWHHIALVMDNDTTDSFFSVYLDGIAQDVDTAAGVQLTRTMTGQGILNLNSQASSFQRFGSSWNNSASSRLDGDYDDIRVYDTALTQTEIQAIMAIPEPSSGIVLGLLGATLLIRRRR